MKTVEIIIIGNEILAGEIHESNAYWLTRRFTRLGATVKRIVVVPDDPAAITSELQSTVKRRPDFLVTSGGLGPTSDDITIKTVSKALSVPLMLNVTALNMVRSQYESFYKEGNVDSPTITESRRKMAYLPKDGVPIPNGVGGAPGVLLEYKGTNIICLPGVPEELKDIFDVGLKDVLAKEFADMVYKERRVWVGHGDETRISPVIDKVAEAHPNVYVKSLARPFEAESRTGVILSASGNSEKEVTAWINAAYDDLEKHLAVLKITLTE